MPAQTVAGQIPVPVFRMLGSDPIYQYDAGLFDGTNCTEVKAQGVVSLEPVYKDGGGNPAWVRWFFKAMTQTPCLAFGYAQVGQENSFGWAGMAAGLTDQVALLDDLQTRGVVRVETLEASGRWFRSKFPVTPATAFMALEDHRKEGRKSIWYESRFHRVNLYWCGDQFRVRDIHLFDERYAERYLTTACPSAACTYDTLPVAEGFLWSDQEVVSGLMPVTVDVDGSAVPMRGGEPRVTEEGAARLRIDWPVDDGSNLSVACDEDSVRWEKQGRPWRMELRWNRDVQVPFEAVHDNVICCRHNGFEYGIECRAGRVELDLVRHCLRLIPVDGQIRLGFRFRDQG
jgi:hypothetical protein